MKKKIVLVSLLLVVAVLGACVTAQQYIARNDKIRLIVTINSTSDKDALMKQGCTFIKDLDVNETVVSCPKFIAGKIPNAVEDKKLQVMDSGERVLPEGAIPLNTTPQDLSVSQYLGVQKLWNAGITGKGSVVAILDTGVDYNHPSLKNNIIANKSFVAYTNDSMDDHGHGTHVTGIIVSQGNPETDNCYKLVCDDQGYCYYNEVDCSGDYDYRYTIPENASKGIAPDAKVAMGKVCYGEGYCYESDIMSGLDWAATSINVTNTGNCYSKCGISKYCCITSSGCTYQLIPKSTKYNCTGTFTENVIVKPDVISISLGSTPGYLFSNCADNTDPLVQKIDSVVISKGIPVVVASGNWPWGVASPACARWAIAAGATGDYNDTGDFTYGTIAYYSGRGFPMADHGVLAPGTSIFSTLPGNTYDYMSGTSMATPMVSGFIALLKQQYHQYSGITLRNRLFLSTTPVYSGFFFPDANVQRYEYGRGQIIVK